MEIVVDGINLIITLDFFSLSSWDSSYQQQSQNA